MSRGSSIAEVRTRHVLNSTGRFTIQADVRLNSGVVGRGSAPTGTTVGSHEAPCIPMERVSDHVRRVSRAVQGVDCLRQDAVDDAIVAALGTTDENRVRAANLACAVSIAACDAAARFRSVPLFRHVADLSGSVPGIPGLAVNVINGGAHNRTGASLTECMLIIPAGDPFEMITMVSRIFQRLTTTVSRKFGPTALGSGLEGGLTPRLNSVEDTCEILVSAITDENVSLGFDAAANTLAVRNGAPNGSDGYSVDGEFLTGRELRDTYLRIKDFYPLSYLEDPFAEHDLSAWWDLTGDFIPGVGDLGVVSDDLTATDACRLAAIAGAGHSFPAHSVMAKVDQCGTISRMLRFVEDARRLGLKIVVSQRSQETDQSSMVDVSVGLGAEMMKAGCITRERIVKYNRLLRIGEELS